MREKHPKRTSQKALARWNNEGGAPKSGDRSARKHPKRPRDMNQAAKLVVDIATGQVEDRERTPEERGKSATAVARGKAGGPKGGRARALKLSPEQRVEIARLAAQTRWKKS